MVQVAGGARPGGRAPVRELEATRARRRRAVYRRRRIGLASGLGILALVVAFILSGPSGPGARGGPAGRAASGRAGAARGSRAPAPPAVEAGLLPWQLPNPVSREVVLPTGRPGSLLVAGGLTASGASSNGVFRLDTSTGALGAVATLPAPTHDAAGAALPGGSLVLGGGTSAPAAETQLVAGNGASVLGALPVARADSSAAVLGGTAYVVGGYDGTALDAEVLATTDGRRFRPVAALPIPVRYPAVTAAGGRVYVLGGETLGGEPVDTIQVVDPASHRAAVVGRLPLALGGASAAELGGTVYLAGGVRRGGADSAAVFAFDPARDETLRAGTLPVALAYAGAATSGGRLWIVGGETASGPTAEVQMLRPDRAFGTAGEPGAGSPYFGDKLLVADRANDGPLLLSDTGRVLRRRGLAPKAGTAGHLDHLDNAHPRKNGDLLVLESNGRRIEERTRGGRLVWTVRLPSISHPSDPQEIGPDRYLVADDTSPGALVEFNRAGRILWRYGPSSGPGELSGPSLVEQLPSGALLVSDEHHDRMVAIDPATGALVWQYGLTGVPGTTPGHLYEPDGFEVLGPGGTTQSHPATG